MNNLAKRNKQIYFKILAAALLYFAALLLARLPVTVYDTYFQYKDIIVLGLLCYLFALHIVKYKKSNFAYLVAFIFLYLLPSYLKLLQHNTLPIAEVTDTFCVAVILFSLLTTMLGLTKTIPFQWGRYLATLGLLSVFSVVVLWPLILIGYYAVSHHVLTTSIILTVFQTNSAEAVAY